MAITENAADAASTPRTCLVNKDKDVFIVVSRDFPPVTSTLS
jgi:hypothetical protein